MKIFRMVVQGNRYATVTCTHSHETAFLKPYKFTVVQKLQEADCVVEVRFCNRVYEAVCNGDISPLLTDFTDKTT
jgi:hypothetical protein